MPAKVLRDFIVVTLAVTSAGMVSASNLLEPPRALVRPFIQTWHGRAFSDPYYWMREKGTLLVENYLKDENRYAAELTAPLKPFEDALYNEMFARIKQDDSSPPTRDGAYYYYSRTQQGKQYPIFCRKLASPDGALSKDAQEEIILDQNALAEGNAYASIGIREVSDDGMKLLYTLDVAGFRQYKLFVKDLGTKKVTGPIAERVTSAKWAPDNSHFFYSTEDATTKRSDTIWKLSLGKTSPEKVIFEDDQLFSLHVGRTKDRHFIEAISTSTDTWETKLLRAKDPNAIFTPVLGRKKGHKYDVEHRDGWLYVRTNHKAKNFRLVKMPLAKPKLANSTILIPHRTDVLLQAVDIFKDFLAVVEMKAGLTSIRIQKTGSKEYKPIVFNDPAYTASLAWNPAFDAKSVRYNYESFVAPNSVYEFDVATSVTTLIKQQEVPGGYAPSRYASERLWANTRDGKKLPISIVYKKGFQKNGEAPLWLYAYGSYGFGLSAGFNSNLFSILDRGVAYAIAHIRGGDEMGEAWHDDGMLMKKKNTFNDYIDAAEFLIREKWTSRGKVLAEGGSAGGLLMGAVTNMRPDLFAAVHLAVPFVDVINTMMDASLPLTTGEYLEWGNPNEKKAFDYMLSYSPYDNIERKKYPPILVTTSYNDSQVMYWEPAKYVAKLRSLKTDTNPLLFKTKMEPAGHGGASGRFDRVRDRAFELAWMLSQVGITFTLEELKKKR